MQRIQEKLSILADAAKYDVSCSSSGSKRQNQNKGLGNATQTGICHTYTEDGRCVSLLKVLLTNHCIYDCAYCVSRKSNDVKRAGFTVEEIVDLTISFYRRNYIEGLFLSSGIFTSADYTMERLVRVAKELRTKHNFHGYIHLKAIPGCSAGLIAEAGKYADRLSVNMELPSEASLKLLAPEKNYKDIFEPMGMVKTAIAESKEARRTFKKAPLFVPAGQSTQMIIGASIDNDSQIVQLAENLYKGYNLKRVYYSGYVPVSKDARLPQNGVTPMVRENRIYQADWLMRFYGFKAAEIANSTYPDLDQDIDPKMGWALRNLNLFPVEINTTDMEMLIRIPGIGIKTAKMICSSRRFGHITVQHLAKMGAVLKRAKYFITCNGVAPLGKDLLPESIKAEVLGLVPLAQPFRAFQLKLF